jgi:flagellar basal-body rod protein FlgB
MIGIVQLKISGIKHLAQLLLFIIKQTGFTCIYWENQMSKTNNIIDVLEAGIKAENLRQKTIANNIANLETPGYRRLDVKFKQLLAKSIDSSGAIDLDDIEPQIFQPEKTPVKSNGNDVHLESEVGEMVKNTLRHKALIRLLSRKYKQIELAIGGSNS